MQVVDQVIGRHAGLYAPPSHLSAGDRAGAVPAGAGADPAGGRHGHSATMAGAEPAGAGRRTVPDPPSTAGDRLSPRTDAESRPDQRPHPTGAGRAGRQASEGCGGDLFGDGGGAHQPSGGYIPTGRLSQRGSEAGSHPDQQGHRLSGDAAAPGTGILDHHRWGELFRPSGCPTFLFWVEEQLHQLFVALHAPAWLHGLLVDWLLPCAGLGGVGDAAAYGHLLPPVHSIGGCGLSAAGGVQSG